MKRSFVLVLCLLSTAFVFYAQNPKTDKKAEIPGNPKTDKTNQHPIYYTGARKLSDDEFNKIPVLKLESEKMSLPSSVDLSEYFPSVGNQENQGSCTGWACGYYYKTYQEFIEMGWNKNTYAYSPSWIYNQTYNNPSGYSALSLIIQKGCDFISEFPYTPADSTKKPLQPSIDRAAKFKGNTLNNASNNITQLKQLLANNQSFVCDMEVHNDLFVLNSSNPIYDNVSDPADISWHCVCIVGYDDTKQAFKFINSWGATWGINGFGWISYSLVSNPYKVHTLVLTDKDNTVNNINNKYNSGAVWLNDPTNNSDYKFYSSDVNGDGKSDIVALKTNGSPHRFVVYINQGNSFSAAGEWLLEPGDYNPYQFRMADVNGDGKSDVVALNTTGTPHVFVTWLSQGNKFSGGVVWLNEPGNYNPYKFDLADVNGDGKSDVVALNTSGTPHVFVSWLSQGNKFSGGAVWLNEPGDYNPYQFKLGDVNGDGKSDVVAAISGGGIYRNVAWLSQGNKFSGGAEWLNEQMNTTNTPSYEFFLGDINHDNKSDVIGIKNSNVRFEEWQSSGVSFNIHNKACLIENPYVGYEFKVSDLNGDGKADVLALVKNPTRVIAWIHK